MSGEVDIDPASLRTHAAAVETFMGQISGATASAGNTFNIEAFGLACIQPAQILQLWTNSAKGFIDDVVTAGHSVSAAIISMAEQYEQNEKDTEAVFASIHSGLQAEAF